MLLLTTAALPQLRQHDHPNLGRLITPRHFCRLADTLAAGYPVAADNDCFQGLNPAKVARMRGRSRRRRPWPHESTAPGAGSHRRRPAPAGTSSCRASTSDSCGWPVPDVIRQLGGRAIGDADATLERFREWHVWLCHLPLAFVLQDGAERPGRVPWEAPGLAAVFVGGSTEWKLGPDAAALVAKARRRGLHAHMGRVSGARRIRYAQSIGCTSFDSSRYSRWREQLLDTGLTQAAQPRQQRLTP